MAGNIPIQHANASAGAAANSVGSEEQTRRRHLTAGRPLTTRQEQLYQFNFELPEDYVPELTDEITKLASLGHKYWIPFAERLTGWTKEVRLRITGREIRDHYYYHGSKKFRTYKAAKVFLYLGYPPSAENADEPLEWWALDQPDPVLVRVAPRASAAVQTHSQVGDHHSAASSSRAIPSIDD